MSNSSQQDRIITLLAKKYHVSENEIKRVVNQQFKTCARIIRLKGANAVRLPYIANFVKKKTK
jgi:hypothetical protein